MASIQDTIRIGYVHKKVKGHLFLTSQQDTLRMGYV